LQYRQVNNFGHSAQQIHEDCFPSHILETIKRHVLLRINKIDTPENLCEYLGGPLRRGGGSDFANHHNFMSTGEKDYLLEVLSSGRFATLLQV
jgi:hypothetical protein